MSVNIKDFIRKARIYYIRLRSVFAKDLKIPEQTLIIAPHPDDEVIGCGGLIARLCAEGKAPHVVILTGGEGSHRECCDLTDGEIISARHNLTLDAARILGLPEDNIHCLDFKDGHIADDMASDKALRLKDLIAEIGPDAIFVPHWGEGWPDHINAAKMVKDIAPAGAQIYEYCVWMWYYNVWHLDWANAYQLKMTADEHRRKLQAIEAYVRPCAPCGKPWSGVLPTLFLNANRWRRELYFKA